MGGKSGGNEAKRAREEEAARQQRIREGTTRINTIFDGQFNDDFFAGQERAFTDYALPQVQDQSAQAGRQLLFDLDRRGQIEGSARADLSAELQKRTDLQTQKVRDDARAFGTTARNNVEAARGDLISLLNATGDAEGAASSALARSEALSRPPAFSPVANLFADFTGALGVQAAAERARFYGGPTAPQPTFNTGLFTPRSGAAVVRA